MGVLAVAAGVPVAAVSVGVSFTAFTFTVKFLCTVVKCARLKEISETPFPSVTGVIVIEQLGAVPVIEMPDRGMRSVLLDALLEFKSEHVRVSSISPIVTVIDVGLVPCPGDAPSSKDKFAMTEIVGALLTMLIVTVSFAVQFGVMALSQTL